MFVQLLGGTFGALLLKWSTPGTMVGSLGAHDLANGIYGAQGLLLEMVLTFVLVFVIFGVAVDRRGPGYQSTILFKNLQRTCGSLGESLISFENHDYNTKTNSLNKLETGW